MEYPKINSLYKREGWYFDQDKKKSPDYQKGRQSFIIGDYAAPEFGLIKKWRIEEKVDGTNIRIFFTKVFGNKTVPTILGRTSDSSVQACLLTVLNGLATWENFDKIFPMVTSECPSTAAEELVLYGEGYGKTIQSAGPKYRKDAGFILFDVQLNRRWMPRECVEEIANNLSIPVVPNLGIFTEDEIVDFVKSKPPSRCSIEQMTMEGVVARTEPYIFNKDGNRIMWKLKCKEFN
jgi:hypothetical protein